MNKKTTPMNLDKELIRKFKIVCAKKDKTMKSEVERLIKNEIEK